MEKQWKDLKVSLANINMAIDEPLREILNYYELLDELQIDVLDTLDIDERVEISYDILRKFIKSLNEEQLLIHYSNEDHAEIPFLSEIEWYAISEAEKGDENVILINI